MPLLFEDAGQPKTRRYQCFVCGKNYENYEEYKEHIVSNHDEGREYLICPDCKSPVRCLKTHYKAKHPSRVMPKNTQTRVAVWHDFKTGPNGKKKEKKQGNLHLDKAPFLPKNVQETLNINQVWNVSFLNV